jgi:hypothetical protein
MYVNYKYPKIKINTNSFEKIQKNKNQKLNKLWTEIRKL